jgi:hypothetical protein
MYYELLLSTSTEFVHSIDRSFPRFRSARLDAVVTALGAAQNNPSAVNLRTLLDRMSAWRLQHPNEFANRGGTNGVGYRLWMEARQGLRNIHQQRYPQFDPHPPGSYPGVTIDGIYVPQANPMEICHGFTFRWAVAAGRLPPNPAMTGLGNHGGAVMGPVLFPLGAAAYPAARVGGALQVQAGDIIGMFDAALQLGHSLIAESPNLWFSANNVGAFGGNVGRSRVDVNAAYGIYGGQQCGWIGAGNQWRRPDNIVATVVYRR